jgi:hypothetical protein
VYRPSGNKRKELFTFKNYIMKLELKHLAPYLPYGLKAVIRLKEDSTLPIDDECIVEISCFEAAYLGSEYDEFKPILRPLIDLSKIKQIAEYYSSFYEHLERINPSTKETQNCALMLDGSIEFQYWNDYQFLLEHHFDIFGLIKKGLAIDINTLN